MASAMLLRFSCSSRAALSIAAFRSRSTASSFSLQFFCIDRSFHSQSSMRCSSRSEWCVRSCSKSHFHLASTWERSFSANSSASLIIFCSSARSSCSFSFSSRSVSASALASTS
uniref:(northern house mosquito) hypothetical protein n=1 Tax=Culex pipiens TaxID=7175 RepID=A0A8D8DZ90_CULPI